MSDEERKMEKTIEDSEACKETYEDKEIDSLEELEKNKKEHETEFNVTGNTAQTQIIIQGVEILGDKVKPFIDDVISPYDVKKYDLKEIKECIEFVEKSNGSESLAVAIILSIFENVEINNLITLKDKLLQRLPKTTCDNERGKEKSQINEYISLDTILAIIGGERFQTKSGQIYASFGENSKKIFRNIWEQFPQLRTYVIEWIIEIKAFFIKHADYGAIQIEKAFARIASVDLCYAENILFPKLYMNKSNEWILGMTIVLLNQEYEKKSIILDIALNWLKLSGTWLWKPVYIAYSMAEDEVFSGKIKNEIQLYIQRRLLSFSKNDLSFLAQLLLYSQKARDLLSAILGLLCEKHTKREDRLRLADIYFFMIKSNYYRINKDNKILPFVVCDTKKQQEELHKVIECVMNEYRLRKQLYIILKAYLKEVAKYGMDEREIRYLSAFFYNMISAGLQYRIDVLDYLKTCSDSISKKIYMQLVETIG